MLAYALYAQRTHATVRLFGAAHAQIVETHAIEHAAHKRLANPKSRAELLTSQSLITTEIRTMAKSTKKPEAKAVKAKPAKPAVKAKSAPKAKAKVSSGTVRTCSVCTQSGHNARTCPKR